jgi:serine protease inhibitor
MPGQTVPAAQKLAAPQYPQMAPYPNERSVDFDQAYDAWRESLRAQRRDRDLSAELEVYFAKTIPAVLAGEQGKNVLCSPVNLYMALAMLAELTGGESREQVLALLDSPDVETLRQQASDVWNVTYRADGAVTRTLGSALFLDDDLDFRQDTMDVLARDYYASSYKGQMGSEGMNQAFRNWLNENTGNLLTDQIDQLELTPEILLALATTVHFQAKWHHEFLPENTVDGIFHSPNGDVDASMMRSDGFDTYYWGDKFSAVAKRFEEGAMWFLLPDEGVTPEELLQDEQAMAFLLNRETLAENNTYLRIHLTVPRFDVSAQLRLNDTLRGLGITNVFDPALADFTPVSESQQLALSRVLHGARVKVDEQGCEGAAYTAMLFAGSARPPEEEVWFTLDRPFLFCVTGAQELPLFVGIVNQP